MQPTKQRTPRDRTGDRLRAQGFDNSYKQRDTGTWRVKCSQCQAMCICGVPCHENGCPNERRNRRRA